MNREQVIAEIEGEIHAAEYVDQSERFIDVPLLKSILELLKEQEQTISELQETINDLHETVIRLENH